MSNYRKVVELRIHDMVNKFEEKYFNLSEIDNIDELTNSAYEDLVKIQQFISKRLYIRDLGFILSKTYIFNKKQLIEKNKQYTKELAAKTQCLLKDNTIFIDPNHSFNVLGFNKTPWIHYDFIGVTEGEYCIDIPTKYPFGILYDFEEYPNKEFNYSVEEKKIEISGDLLGETETIIEDKWINAPGDIDDDDAIDGLLNIGPYEFKVNFYTGKVKLKITGNFGRISYYIKGHGYMGGIKRLKYSEVCLKPDG